MHLHFLLTLNKPGTSIQLRGWGYHTGDLNTLVNYRKVFLIFSLVLPHYQALERK